MEREREAENRLDDVLSQNAKQITQRQVRSILWQQQHWRLSAPSAMDTIEQRCMPE